MGASSFDDYVGTWMASRRYSLRTNKKITGNRIKNAVASLFSKNSVAFA